MGFFQLAILLRQRLRKRLVTLHLAAVLHGELVHQDRGKKEEQNADCQLPQSRLSEIVFMKRKKRYEIGAVGERGQRRPQEGSDGAKVNGRRDYRQIINRIV